MFSDNRKGATLHKDGCFFVVWAPHADMVYVIGSFNNWNKTSHPMTAQSNGVWHIDIPDVQSGDEYKYRIIQGDSEYLRNDPYARRVTHSAGNTIIKAAVSDKSKDSFTPPLPHEMIMYELHIGTFGKSHDQPGPGTLQGAIDRLPYLKELGINVIEVMPLAEFPGEYSWGYNPSHIFAVESDYGAPRTFLEFVQEAHHLGIAVIVDVVYNHLGPDDLDLWQFDGWHENNKGGIYFYNDWRSQTPWGDTRPDYGRQEVREFIRDNVLMWIEEYQVDGLRWDSTLFIRNVYGHDNDPENDLAEGWSLMQWVNQETKAVRPYAVLIAEDLQGNQYITKPQHDGGAGFDTQWCARFVHAIRAALIEVDDAARDMQSIQNAVLHQYNENGFARVIYTESHDEVANGKARVPEEVAPGDASSWIAKKKSSLGATIVFCACGIPMIFQGQEFLEDAWFHDQDPIDWTRRKRFSGIVKLYKDLIALRLNHEGKTQGLLGQGTEICYLSDKDKVIVFHRWDKGGAGDSVVIVANFSSQTYENYGILLPAPGEWVTRFNSDSKHYDEEFGDSCCPAVLAVEMDGHDKQQAHATIHIAPYSALILSQDYS